MFWKHPVVECTATETGSSSKPNKTPGLVLWGRFHMQSIALHLTYWNPEIWNHLVACLWEASMDSRFIIISKMRERKLIFFPALFSAGAILRPAVRRRRTGHGHFAHHGQSHGYQCQSSPQVPHPALPELVSLLPCSEYTHTHTHTQVGHSFSVPRLPSPR